MQPGAPQLHDGVENNVACAPKMGHGDIDKGFEEADHIFESVYQTQRVHTCYMEPRVCVVHWDVDGKITVNSSQQHLHGLREKIAYRARGPGGRRPGHQAAVYRRRVRRQTGCRAHGAHRRALLSRKTGRPVRIEHTRYEDFITTTRNPIKVYLKTGVKNDGTFTARYAKSILDAGAHATHGGEVINVHGFVIMSNYVCPNVQWEGYSVYTNNMIGGGYRGYGAPQAVFAMESQNDEICETLGLDPIEFHRKNTPRGGGAPHPLAPGLTVESYALDEVLDRGTDTFGWDRKQPTNSSDGPKKKGMGFALFPFWVSGCVGFPDIYEHSGAIIKFTRDGTAHLSSATMDIGSGQTVAMLQIAAEELGVPFESMRMVEHTDTDSVPFDAPTHASRVTYSAGNAVKAAATQAREKLLEVAGLIMEANAADLVIEDGVISVKGAPDKSITVAEVATRADSPFIQFGDQGPAPTNLAEKGTIMGMSNMAPPSNPTPVAAGFAEVEVDTETGNVKVERFVYAHDIGKVINPNAAEGQVEGGFQQGMGFALTEEIQFDPDSGSCLTGDFLDYKMPTAVEMPRRIESVFIESNEPTGPFGAKSLSEACCVVPAPAIANAIYNATGARIKDLPITPEKVLKALGEI